MAVNCPSELKRVFEAEFTALVTRGTIGRSENFVKLTESPGRILRRSRARRWKLFEVRMSRCLRLWHMSRDVAGRLCLRSTLKHIETTPIQICVTFHVIVTTHLLIFGPINACYAMQPKPSRCPTPLGMQTCSYPNTKTPVASRQGMPRKEAH